MENDRKFWVVMVGLAVVSFWYDRLISWADKRNKLEEWTWLTVVVGTAYTLLGVALLDRRAAWLCFRAFCFSGAAMAGGDIWRHLNRKWNGERLVMRVQKAME